MSSHAGKVYAITGAGSGIGLATAKKLASHGASVSLADINPRNLESASNTIKGKNPAAKIFTQVVDVRRRSDVSSWIKATVQALGRLDGAVNMAGRVNPALVAEKNIEGVPDEEWDAVIGINLTGTMISITEELRAMKVLAGKSGNSSRQDRCIVSATSVTGLVGKDGTSAYSASKHGVIGLTESVARETAKDGIRVNAVAPGIIETPMVTQGNGELIDSASKPVHLFALRSVMTRAGQSEEVGELIAFLLSDKASFITGSIYPIDGGFLA